MKTNHEDEKTDSEQADIDKESDNKIEDGTIEAAIEGYRKVVDNGDRELTENEIAEIDKQCEIIRNREVVTQDTPHDTV